MDPRRGSAGPKGSEQTFNTLSSSTSLASRQASDSHNSAKHVALSPAQQDVLDRVARWRFTERQIFFLDGYAGTGKTTIAALIPALWNGPVHFAAFTGKAAARLRQLGCPDATTLHRFLYHPPQIATDVDGREQLLWNRRHNPVSRNALIVVDECSTVGPVLWDHLYRLGVKIVSIQDPFQLPPMDGARVFNDGEPNAFLTEIHRQAFDSDVLRIATDIRQGQPIPPKHPLHHQRADQSRYRDLRAERDAA
jgi:exodeoxyribonuclease-5